MDKKRILIDGYFGAKNAGDELILDSIIGNVRDELSNVEIIITSHDFDYSDRNHDVDEIIEPFRLKSNLLEWIKILNKVDEYWVGSGESLDAVHLKYPTITVIARLIGVKMRFISVGATELEPNFLERKLLRYMFTQVDGISTRDPISFNKISTISDTEIVLSADPVFSLRRYWMEDRTGMNDSNQLVITARDTNERYFDVEGFVQGLNSAFYKINCNVILLQMDTSEDLDTSPPDLPILLEIQDKLNCPSTIKTVQNFKDKYNCISQSGMLVGMRLHSIIAAVNNGIPYVHIAYHRKCKAHMGILSDTNCFDSREIHPIDLSNTIIQRWKENQFYTDRNDELDLIKNRSSRAVVDVINRTDSKSRLYIVPLIILLILYMLYVGIVRKPLADS